jgi:hypothetical protein
MITEKRTFAPGTPRVAGCEGDSLKACAASLLARFNDVAWDDETNGGEVHAHFAGAKSVRDAIFNDNTGGQVWVSSSLHETPYGNIYVEAGESSAQAMEALGKTAEQCYDRVSDLGGQLEDILLAEAYLENSQAVIERSKDMDRLRDFMQRHAIASIAMSYSGGSGTVDRFDGTVEAAEGATDEIRAACESGEILEWPASDASNERSRLVREVVDGALDDILQKTGHESFYREAGGNGEVTFWADGSCELKHAEILEYGVESDYAIDAEGTVSKTGGSDDVDDVKGRLASALTALEDAVTALRDLDAGFPAGELHKSVEEIVANAAAVLREHGVILDLEPKASAPAPGM